jgi:hypothetical protein
MYRNKSLLNIFLCFYSLIYFVIGTKAFGSRLPRLGGTPHGTTQIAAEEQTVAISPLVPLPDLLNLNGRFVIQGITQIKRPNTAQPVADPLPPLLNPHLLKKSSRAGDPLSQSIISNWDRHHRKPATFRTFRGYRTRKVSPFANRSFFQEVRRSIVGR